MRKVIIDTNIFYEILLEESLVIDALIRAKDNHRFIINLQIIAELIVLFRTRGKDWLLFKILDPLLQGNIFEIEELNVRDIRRAASVLKKYKDKLLSFTDCLILAQAANNNYLVWTKDQEMRHCKECEFFEPGRDL